MDLPDLSEKQEKNFNLEKFFQNNKLSFILGFIGIFLIGVGLLSATILSSKQEETTVEIIPAEKEVQENKEIYVHIAGAVQKPGLYKLPADSRVNDALVTAEGLSAEANRAWFEKNVNLAQQLEDGAKLYFPFKDESLNSSGNVAGSQTSVFVTNNGGKVNINTATLSELDTLTGIGPAYGQKIIDNRPYSKIDDLLKVPGIGPKTLDNIKDQITL